MPSPSSMFVGELKFVGGNCRVYQRRCEGCGRPVLFVRDDIDLESWPVEAIGIRAGQAILDTAPHHCHGGGRDA